MAEDSGILHPRKLALVLGAVLVSGAVLAAPPGNGPGQRDGARHGPPGAEQQLAHLDSALDLSDEQSAQVLELLQAAEAERRALQEEIMEQFRPQLCALRNDTDAGILALLTQEQAGNYEALKENRRQHRGFGPAGLDCDD